MSQKEGSTALAARPNDEDAPRPLPATLEPMMLTHLMVTGDTGQYNEWRDRVEAILQAEAVDEALSTLERVLEDGAALEDASKKYKKLAKRSKRSLEKGRKRFERARARNSNS